MRIRMKIRGVEDLGLRIADWGSGIEEIKNRKGGPREEAKKFLFTAEGALREMGDRRWKMGGWS